MVQVVRKLVRRLGFDLIRYSSSSSRDARLQLLLASANISAVLDVGANTGQYAAGLLAGGYQGRIISFEPLAAEHAHLQRRARGYKRWQVAPRMAIGATEGQLTLHRAANSVSSSALPILSTHLAAAPQSHTIGQEIAPIHRLDSLWDSYIQPTDQVLLKLDTQGYELPALQGAAACLQHIQALQVELSLTPLYEGQALLPTLLDYLLSAGYKLVGVEPGFTDPATGQMLQVDGFFIKAQLLPGHQ